LLDRTWERDNAVHKFGNLTLLTHSLNSTVSNGPYSVKMPAIKSHSSLYLNRDLNDFETWDENSIKERGVSLFAIAKTIWGAPQHVETPSVEVDSDFSQLGQVGLPSEGTNCTFKYRGKLFEGIIEAGKLKVAGFDRRFGSFSAASGTVTATSRNGWRDWMIQLHDNSWILADDWRQDQIKA
jgi:Protein of unknown function (DUF1524)